MYTYRAEDIFTDIPNDPDNVNMTLPPDVMAAAGIVEGDTIQILREGDRIIIKKVTDGEE